MFNLIVYCVGAGTDYNSSSGAGYGGGGGSGVPPVMMSFKTFLGTQDDSISGEEAIKKYADYKLEFSPQSELEKIKQKVELETRAKNRMEKKYHEKDLELAKTIANMKKLEKTRSRSRERSREYQAVDQDRSSNNKDRDRYRDRGDRDRDRDRDRFRDRRQVRGA